MTTTLTAEWLNDRRVELSESFDSAAASVGSMPVRLAIAGGSVSLECAGPVIRERLARAFAHLEIDSAPATDLTIRLWDSRSSGSEPPPLPDVPPDPALGALYHFDEPPLRASYQPGLETLSVLDAEAGVAWHWVGDAYALPYWEQACPIRQLLFWWLGGRGYLQVHGGSVGTENGGVLLVGRAGSGKSTSALACLRSELLYAGDDYVAVCVEPAPRVQSLYNSGKLEPDHVRGLLPHLLPALANRDRLDVEKAVLYVHEEFPKQATQGFPLRAIVVPSVRAEQREPRIVRTGRAAAFAALAPSTMVQLHTAGSDAWAMMSTLTESVPCYGLELGSDIDAIPHAIADFLAGLSSGE